MKLPAELEAQILAMPGVTVNGLPIVKPAESQAVAHNIGETTFQDGVVEYAEAAGWEAFHVTIAKKSKAGWPDLVLFKHRIVAIELKVEPNKPTADQLAWIDRFNAAGAEAFVAYPEDWPRVKAILDECPKSPTNRGEL